MLVGRIVGWIMVLVGAGVAWRNYDDWVWFRAAQPWDIETGSFLEGLQHELSNDFSALMGSGATAIILVVIGLAMLWFCRRLPKEARLR